MLMDGGGDSQVLAFPPVNMAFPGSDSTSTHDTHSFAALSMSVVNRRYKALAITYSLLRKVSGRVEFGLRRMSIRICV